MHGNFNNKSAIVYIMKWDWLQMHLQEKKYVFVFAYLFFAYLFNTLFEMLVNRSIICASDNSIASSWRVVFRDSVFTIFFHTSV